MLHQILLDDQIKEDEMGGTCSTHRRYEKCIQTFSRKTWRGESTRKV